MRNLIELRALVRTADRLLALSDGQLRCVGFDSYYSPCGTYACYAGHHFGSEERMYRLLKIPASAIPATSNFTEWFGIDFDLALALFSSAHGVDCPLDDDWTADAVRAELSKRRALAQCLADEAGAECREWLRWLDAVEFETEPVLRMAA